MEDQAVCDVSVSNPEFDISHSDQGVSSNESGVQDSESSMKVLTKVDLDLAYSAEKLANLQALMMRLFSQENDLESMATANNCILADFHEKVLVFNLLSSILDSEVREMDSFMDTLQAEIVDARQTIFSCSHLGEQYTAMEEKLYDSEESLKQCQEQVSEVKMLAAKFRRTAIAFVHDNRKTDIALASSEDGQLSNNYAKYNMQMPRQQRHNLRMLEKSLSREIDFEKKLTQSRQNEEQLQLKLHYTEQVAVRMEEAAEGIWGRFLEAENAAEVLQGISKDLLGRLQLLNFNLNGSFHRESELKSKLQDCLVVLQAKDALQKLEHISAETITKDAEKRNRNGQANELDQTKPTAQQPGESTRDDTEMVQRGASTTNKTTGKLVKQGSQMSDPPKEEYIHVRARRGQATNSHSLAERVRREKISERMKFLQDLVPGCSKVTGKVVMLDEIINYVQSLQRQVEFLSMKLASVNPRLNLNVESLLEKDMLQSRVGPSSSSMGYSPDMHIAYPPLNPSQSGLIQAGLPGMGSTSDLLRRAMGSQMAPMTGGFKDPSQVPNGWEDELQNVLQMSYGTGTPSNSHVDGSGMKVEL